MAQQKMIELRVKRQDNPTSEPYWERFAIPWQPSMNIISCLIEIARNPVTAEGKRTTPVAWECACLEEVCGSCTMLIGGHVRQSCSALVDRLEQPITLAPMGKFPLVRDLVVDRQIMFENLKRIRGWVPIDGSYPLGPGPKVDPKTNEMRYNLSRCMTCACCLEACPQVNERSNFIGPAAIGQTHYFNLHPTGAALKDERLDVMTGEGGVDMCGKAQNCVEVCPKGLNLIDAISAVNRDATWHMLKKVFQG